MHFKLIAVIADEDYTDKILAAARSVGATGATVISNARGEGLDAKKGFWGLSIDTMCEILIFVVEEHLSLKVLETIEEVGNLDDKNSGIAFQIDIDDVVGIGHQIESLQKKVEDEL